MDINQMNLYESTLRLLADLWDLCRSEHLSMEQRLRAIDHAIGLAIGGPPEQARDWGMSP